MPHKVDYHPPAYDESLGALFNDLTKEVSDLIHEEIALARVEMTDKAKKLGSAGAMLGVAALVGLLALGTLTAAIVLALANVLAPWLAALIVAAVYAIAAGIVGLIGYRRMREAGKPLPEQTIESVKEDISWAKRQAKSAMT